MSEYKLIVAPEVRYDIREAKLWYKDKSPTLPRRFATEVRTTIEQVKLRPTTHAIRYNNIRIANLPIFPYAIHYTVEENIVVVLAVFHAALNPEKWLNRNK
ncbi:hypothetical protein A9P82_09935 [Arachidicoccus ginsenosidimutans]|uniref:type II toxin-antitoxin system RelE/ParE family toxin n=1 Tax=Arachidicoccus sp. BS20 TaxID=1850526 RepID=UPI0007F07A5C|nr:type II toxin-antitoxin system RelE/ParE family toxin [Arachidicoccus sp. BS20]ANI89582.1 hypothetical protein A9P82_09935 [Arachidicoccus sp. BS20]